MREIAPLIIVSFGRFFPCELRYRAWEGFPDSAKSRNLAACKLYRNFNREPFFRGLNSSACLYTGMRAYGMAKKTPEYEILPIGDTSRR